MRHTVERRPAGLVAVDATPLQQAGGDAAASIWLERQATRHGLTWLLAHADDGVIWGRIDSGRLVTSYEAAQADEASGVCPPLRTPTLQQARLFASGGELLLWRMDERTWRARLIRDLPAASGAAGAQGADVVQWEEALDEPHLLWGTRGRALPYGFTLLEDGAQGLRHAVPLGLRFGPDGTVPPPRLLVRHYLNRDGVARIVASRLLDVQEGIPEGTR